MIALIVHEREISRQIESTERRAEQRCKNYNPTNVHWQVVDSLIEKQHEITQNMDNITNAVPTDEDMGMTSIVTEFMQKDSVPTKSSAIIIDIANSNGMSHNNDNYEYVDVICDGPQKTALKMQNKVHTVMVGQIMMMIVYKKQ